MRAAESRSCWDNPFPSLLLGGPGGQNFLLHHPHLHPSCDSGKADVLPRLGTQVWGAKSEKLGCPAAPIQQPRDRRPFWEEMLLHVRWACSGSRFERE